MSARTVTAIAARAMGCHGASPPAFPPARPSRGHAGVNREIPTVAIVP